MVVTWGSHEAYRCKGWARRFWYRCSSVKSKRSGHEWILVLEDEGSHDFALQGSKVVPHYRLRFEVDRAVQISSMQRPAVRKAPLSGSLIARKLRYKRSQAQSSCRYMRGAASRSRAPSSAKCETRVHAAMDLTAKREVSVPAFAVQVTMDQVCHMKAGQGLTREGRAGTTELAETPFASRASYFSIVNTCNNAGAWR